MIESQQQQQHQILLGRYKDLLLSSSQPDYAHSFDQAVLDHLATAGPRGRLAPLVAESVKKSVAENLVPLARVGHALRVMETYAKNIYLMPWKKEFHVITTYSAVYINDLEPTLFTLPQLLTSLDYVLDASQYVWRWTETTEKLRYLERALDFRLGALECQVLDSITKELYPLTVLPSIIYDFRAATPGDDKATAMALRHKILQAKQSGDAALVTVAKGKIEDLATVATDQISGDATTRDVRPADKVKRLRFKDAEVAPDREFPSVESRNSSKYLDIIAPHFIDDENETEELVFLPPKLSAGRGGQEGRIASLNLRGETGPMLPPKKSEAAATNSGAHRSPVKANGGLIPDLIRNNYGRHASQPHYYTNFKAPPPPPPPLPSFKHSYDLVTASNDLYSRRPDLDIMLNMVRDIGDLDMASQRDLILASRRDLDMTSRRDLETTSRRDLDMISRFDLDMTSRRDLETTSQRDRIVTSPRDIQNANAGGNKGILSVRNLTYAPRSNSPTSTTTFVNDTAVTTTLATVATEGEKKTRFHVDL